MPLTPEQKEQAICDLVELDWVRPPADLHPRSTQLISKRIGCSAEEASLILEKLESEGMIASVSESEGTPAHNRELNSYGWRWVRR
jgi:hypothetical protein